LKNSSIGRKRKLSSGITESKVERPTFIVGSPARKIASVGNVKLKGNYSKQVVE
jgi:hypothetical protein